MRILLVDDHEVLMVALAQVLTQQRYVVDIATDADTAWEYLSLFAYDLIVLDILLPKGDGINLCRQLRTQGYDCPILMLSACDSSDEKVKALDAGADDYVVKPFNLDELLARFRALLRRESHGLPSILQWGQLCLDPSAHDVTYQAEAISLTPKEFALCNLSDRLAVVRQGACMVMQQPVTDGQIMDAIAPLLQSVGQQAKILIVDDDPHELASLQFTLAPWGNVINHSHEANRNTGMSFQVV